MLPIYCLLLFTSCIYSAAQNTAPLSTSNSEHQKSLVSTDTEAAQATVKHIVSQEQEIVTPQKNASERTFAIIKPHAVTQHLVGKILSLVEDNKFTLVALKLHQLTAEEATALYAEHKDKPFFVQLINMMTSAPSIVMVLERTDALQAWRELAGATNPHDARPGTIRAMYGESAQDNAVHGSSSRESAAQEIAIIFPELVVGPHGSPAQALHQLAQAEIESDALRPLSPHEEKNEHHDAVLDEDDSLSLTLPEVELQQPPVQHQVRETEQKQSASVPEAPAHEVKKQNFLKIPA